MVHFGQGFKYRTARLLPPGDASLEQISPEVGVSIHTLERWRSNALVAPAEQHDC